MRETRHTTSFRYRALRFAPRFTWIAAAAALLLVPATARAEHDDDAYPVESSYSFARVVEGPATLLTADDREELELHQPILVGDRVWAPEGTRLEVVLADRSLLRLEGDGEVAFERIAYSSETEDRETLLRLERGALQLVVPADALGDALPRLDTPAATVYVHREGTFGLTVGRDGWTELVVREGLAELVTERGSSLVHPGEAARVADFRASPEVRTAGYRTGLERWGDSLTAVAAAADLPYVDRHVRYAAAPLAEHGVWVEVGSRRAWRPRVAVGWRPYHHGYWRTTPLGATWVSYDPWGWATHHYGSWDYVPGYGWIWYPGSVWAPARVHWYVGPSYVGWCPSGYYANYYGRYPHYRRGLHFGLYGWAGGHWGHFSHWTFTLSIHLGDRHQHRHHHPGHYLARHGGHLDRGLITTDPGFRGRRHHRPEGIYDDLHRLAQERERQGHRLPQVDDFVGRKPLRDDVATAVLRREPGAGWQGPNGRAADLWRAGWEKPAVAPTDPRERRSAAAERPNGWTRSGETKPGESWRAVKPAAPRDGDWRARTRRDAPATRPEASAERPSWRGPTRGEVTRDNPSATRPGSAERSDWRTRSGARERDAGSATTPRPQGWDRSGSGKPAVRPEAGRERPERYRNPTTDTWRQRGRETTTDGGTRSRPETVKPAPRSTPPSTRGWSKPEARKPEARKPEVRKPAGPPPTTRSQPQSRSWSKPEARKPEVRKPAGPPPTTRSQPQSRSWSKPEARKPEARKPAGPPPTTRSQPQSRSWSKPETRKPAPRATMPQRPTTRKPAARSTAPRPTTRSTAPRSWSKPEARSSAPRPSTRSTAPRPSTRSTAPRPSTRSSQPRSWSKPATRTAPRPTTRTAPRPTTRSKPSTAPRPTTRSKAPAGSWKRPAAKAPSKSRPAARSKSGGKTGSKPASRDRGRPRKN